MVALHRNYRSNCDQLVQEFVLKTEIEHFGDIELLSVSCHGYTRAGRHLSEFRYNECMSTCIAKSK